MEMITITTVKDIEEMIESLNESVYELSEKDLYDSKWNAVYHAQLNMLERILSFKERGETYINSYTRLFSIEDVSMNNFYLDFYNVDSLDDLRKSSKLIFKDCIVGFEDFLQETGNGAYKIIIDDSSDLDSNTFFFESKDFFNNDGNRVKPFLFEAKRVILDNNMIIIPFQIKDEFYYIMADNLSENLFLSDAEGGFRYINKQSNLYDIIRSIRREELNDNPEYKGDLLEELRISTGFNKKLIKEIYDKPKLILISKYFIKRFSERYIKREEDKEKQKKNR